MGFQGRRLCCKTREWPAQTEILELSARKIMARKKSDSIGRIYVLDNLGKTKIVTENKAKEELNYFQ